MRLGDTNEKNAYGAEFNRRTFWSGTAAWAEETVTTPTSEVTATSTSEAPATIAAAPAAEETPAAPTPTAKLDTGDTSWILISTAFGSVDDNSRLGVILRWYGP